MSLDVPSLQQQTASRTRSSRRTARRESGKNGPARTGLLLGVAAVIVEPAALLLARWTSVSLVQAGFSAPIAAVLGVAAILASRRGRLLNDRTLGRVGGLRAIRFARWLGLLGLCLAAIVGIALGFYGLLLLFEH